MVDSFRADFSRMLELRLSHDVFVRSAGTDVGEVTRVLRDLPQVTDVVASGQVMVRVDGLPVELGFSRFDAAQARRYGITSALEPYQALANERLLRLLDVSTGETLRVNGHELTLVGAFPGFGDALPRLLVDTDTAAVLASGLVFDRLSVTTAAAPLVSSLLAARYPQLDVQLAQPLRQMALRIFDQTFAITRALTLLALLVACIGLYNALLGLKLLAQPTLTLLQNMGVSAAEVRQIALWRGLAVGAGVMGFALPLGVMMGAILCSVINPRAFGWSLQLQLTPAAVMVPVLLGFAVIVITSLLPAPGEKLAETG
jgi:putative ABC transport system permease protein